MRRLGGLIPLAFRDRCLKVLGGGAHRGSGGDDEAEERFHFPLNVLMSSCVSTYSCKRRLCAGLTRVNSTPNPNSSPGTALRITTPVISRRIGVRRRVH